MEKNACIDRKCFLNILTKDFQKYFNRLHNEFNLKKIIKTLNMQLKKIFVQQIKNELNPLLMFNLVYLWDRSTTIFQRAEWSWVTFWGVSCYEDRIHRIILLHCKKWVVNSWFEYFYICFFSFSVIHGNTPELSFYLNETRS